MVRNRLYGRGSVRFILSSVPWLLVIYSITVSYLYPAAAELSGNSQINTVVPVLGHSMSPLIKEIGIQQGFVWFFLSPEIAMKNQVKAQSMLL